MGRDPKQPILQKGFSSTSMKNILEESFYCKTEVSNNK